MTHFGRNVIAGAIQCDSSGIIYNNFVRAALYDENIKKYQKSNLSRNHASSWSIGTRTCSMLSRMRMVTALSSADSKS